MVQSHGLHDVIEVLHCPRPSGVAHNGVTRMSWCQYGHHFRHLYDTAEPVTWLQRCTPVLLMTIIAPLLDSVQGHQEDNVHITSGWSGRGPGPPGPGLAHPRPRPGSWTGHTSGECGCWALIPRTAHTSPFSCFTLRPYCILPNLLSLWQLQTFLKLITSGSLPFSPIPKTTSAFNAC